MTEQREKAAADPPLDCWVMRCGKSEDALAEKWLWKMEYCKKQKIPPAQTWAWDESEAAFAKAHNPKISVP